VTTTRARGVPRARGGELALAKKKTDWSELSISESDAPRTPSLCSSGRDPRKSRDSTWSFGVTWQKAK
jgi:hypothetical protein